MRVPPPWTAHNHKDKVSQTLVRKIARRCRPWNRPLTFHGAFSRRTRSQTEPPVMARMMAASASIPPTTIARKVYWRRDASVRGPRGRVELPATHVGFAHLMLPELLGASPPRELLRGRTRKLLDPCVPTGRPVVACRRHRHADLDERRIPGLGPLLNLKAQRERVSSAIMSAIIKHFLRLTRPARMAILMKDGSFGRALAWIMRA